MVGSCCKECVFLGVTFIILQSRQLDQLNGAIVNNGHFSHNCNEISVGCFFLKITSTSGFKNKLENKEPLGFQILENCIYKLELII